MSEEEHTSDVEDGEEETGKEGEEEELGEEEVTTY